MGPDGLGAAGRNIRQVVFIRGLDFRKPGKKKDAGQQQNPRGDAGIGNPKLLVRGFRPVFRVEEHPPDDRTQDPAHPVETLGDVDPHRGVFRIPQHGGVGIGDGFQKGQAHRDNADAQEKGPKGGDLRRGNEPEASDGDSQQTENDPALVT